MDLKVLIEQASSLYSKKEYQASIEVLNRLIEQKKDDADLYELRAMCSFHLGKYSESLLDFDKARDLEPNNPFRYSSRAYVKSVSGDVDGAVKDYENAVHLDPEDAVSHNNLGLLLEKKGYKSQAQEQFQLADTNSSSIPEVKAKSEDVSLNKAESKEKKEVVTISGLALKTLGSKQLWKEFMQFIRSGFKIKQ